MKRIKRHWKTRESVKYLNCTSSNNLSNCMFICLRSVRYSPLNTIPLLSARREFISSYSCSINELPSDIHWSPAFIQLDFLLMDVFSSDCTYFPSFATTFGCSSNFYLLVWKSTWCLTSSVLSLTKSGYVCSLWAQLVVVLMGVFQGWLLGLSSLCYPIHPDKLYLGVTKSSTRSVVLFDLGILWLYVMLQLMFLIYRNL